MEITYYRWVNYGREIWYPVSKDAVMICKLMGKRTLTEWAIKVLKANGATIDEVLLQTPYPFQPRNERSK